MDKKYCKCCEHFAITRGSQSLEESILCKKHNTVCEATNENLHDSCPDFKARNRNSSVVAKALALGAFVELLKGE